MNRCQVVLSSVSCGRPARLGSAIRGHNSRSNLQFHSRDWYNCRMLNGSAITPTVLLVAYRPSPTMPSVWPAGCSPGRVKRVCLYNNVLGGLFYNAVGTFAVLSTKQFLNLLKPTGYVMHQQFNILQLYALPTLYSCFIFIWEQTATCATYSINWLVFITEMKSVYSAVRTGSLNKAVCASFLNG
jgi:hypothetical protein